MTRARTLSLLGNENNFTVTGSNNVGIGSTLPDGKLDVGGDIVVGTAITISSVSGIISATDFYVNGVSITGAAGTWATFTSGGEGGISTTKKVKIENGLEVTGISTFSGDLTVGGVLTYDDVTNVDSIGIITARSDVSIADKIIHTGDTNTAIRFPAADTFTVETANSERLRVDSSGNVGINSTGQIRQLEIYHGTHATASLNSETQSSLFFSKPTDTNIGQISYNHGGDYMYFRVNDAERVRITSTGLVGIGTDNPNLATLAVVGSVLWADSSGGTFAIKQRGDTNNDGITITSSNSNSGRIFKDADGKLILYNTGTTGTDQLVLTNSGQGAVGINSLSPTETFDIDSAGTPTTMKIRSTTQSSILFDDIGGSPKQYRIGTNINGNNSQFEIYDDTNNESRLVVGTAGSFGLNNSNPLEVLHIKYNADSSSLRTTLGVSPTNSGFRVENENTTTNATAGVFLRVGDADAKISCVRKASDQADLEIILDNNGGNRYLTIEGADGDVLPGSDNAQDLGSASLRWANIYSADLQLSNEGSSNDVDGTWGQYTIQEGENDLFLLNRRNGKTYKFVLEEVN